MFKSKKKNLESLEILLIFDSHIHSRHFGRVYNHLGHA